MMSGIQPSTPPRRTAFRCWSRPSATPSPKIAISGKFEAIMQRRGGELLPVFLHCSRDEAMRRVGNPDRVERRKMASGDALANYLDSNNFTAAPQTDCLKLDTGAAPAEVTAQKIVDHFGLTPAAT
jgi:hypothetical protein